MFLTDSKEDADKVRKWSTQSREAAPWYQHDSLRRATNFVCMIEQYQGMSISAPEEIAYRFHWIDKEQLEALLPSYCCDSMIEPFRKANMTNLKDSGIVPDLENSINQLQELYQKKYVGEAPQYTFDNWQGDEWNCDCVCGGMNGYGRGIGKTKAKKAAAFMVLKRLMGSW